MFKINDEVVLKKDTLKNVYIVISKYLKNELNCYTIKGKNHRIKLECFEDELEHASKDDLEYEEKVSKKYIIGVSLKKERYLKQKYVLGKILHIDGDKDYLDKCLGLYEEIGVYAYGITLKENTIISFIKILVEKVNPEIIVITGHDLYNNQGLFDINNYVNTKYFIDVIKIIKNINPNVVIIAGACQSNFEALIASGADFASSPKRINIHTYDPAIIAIKVATTSFNQIVDISEVIKYIENGKDAFSGLQTLGKMRLML